MTDPISQPISQPGALSPEDWMAAHVGLHDAAQHGCRAAPREQLGLAARLLTWLWGDEPPQALANPRLDAVRRFVCATRAGHRPGIALMSELHTHGLQPAHLAALGALVM